MMTEEEFKKISQAIKILKRYLYIEEIVVTRDKYLELNEYIRDIFPSMRRFETFNGVRLTPSSPV